MKKLVFLLGFLSLIINSTAQEPMSCAMLGDGKNPLPMGFLKNKSNRDINTPKEIKVVVHIVYTDAIENTYVPSEAIQPAIDQLNVDFEGTNISFELVGYDYTDLSTYAWHDAYVNGQVCFPSYQTQITQLTDDIAWDLSEYCNIYVVPKMCSTILGFAYVGYGPSNSDDGAWVLTETFGTGTWPHLDPSHNENEVLTHEIGHYCGLFHTFNMNPGSCGGQDPNISCEYEGDYVCDTPPTKASSGCPGVPGYHCPTIFYDGGVPFNARNHMDYGPQACRNEFTPGQIDRMHAMLEYQRYELYSDDSVVPFCPGDFNGDGNIGTADFLVVLAHYGCIGCGPSQGDATLDYRVTVSDLNWILANWGETCGDGIGMLEGDNVNLPQSPSKPKQTIPYKTLVGLLAQEPRPILEVNYYDIVGRKINIVDIAEKHGIYLVEIVLEDGNRIVLKTIL
jgi:hypothetical protein